MFYRQLSFPLISLVKVHLNAKKLRKQQRLHKPTLKDRPENNKNNVRERNS